MRRAQGAQCRHLTDFELSCGRRRRPPDTRKDTQMVASIGPPQAALRVVVVRPPRRAAAVSLSELLGHGGTYEARTTRSGPETANVRLEGAHENDAGSGDARRVTATEGALRSEAA